MCMQILIYIYIYMYYIQQHTNVFLAVQQIWMWMVTYNNGVLRFEWCLVLKGEDDDERSCTRPKTNGWNLEIPRVLFRNLRGILGNLYKKPIYEGCTLEN